jgi:hypothetical protein
VVNAAPALARGRAAAESLMVDTCTIRHRTGETTDTTTGVVTPTTTTVYTGRCKVQQSTLGAASEPRDPGEASVRLVAYAVHLPVATSTGIRDGDEITITAAGHDPDLVGKVFTVLGTMAKTYATARRLQVQEVAT